MIVGVLPFRTRRLGHVYGLLNHYTTRELIFKEQLIIS